MLNTLILGLGLIPLGLALTFLSALSAPTSGLRAQQAIDEEYTAQILEFTTEERAVADASPRVQVHTIGRTEEGRELILVLESSEENLQNLEVHKANTARLGDPRVTSEAEAASLISSTVPMYWATGAIHSPETGSPEMLMELVFSFNPFWRSETLGSYGLVFNTIMHYRSLSTAREPPLTDDE